MSLSAEEELKEFLQNWIITGWKQGNTDMLDQFHTSDFKDYDPSGRQDNLEGFKEGIRKLYTAFPDFSAEVKDIIIEKDLSKAAVRWSGKGTHKNTYLGCNPTGKTIHFKGIEILILQNGKIKKRWGEWDGLNILDQLKKG